VAIGCIEYLSGYRLESEGRNRESGRVSMRGKSWTRVREKSSAHRIESAIDRIESLAALSIKYSRLSEERVAVWRIEASRKKQSYTSLFSVVESRQMVENTLTPPTAEA
jgi:hypothetical protein